MIGSLECESGGEVNTRKFSEKEKRSQELERSPSLLTEKQVEELQRAFEMTRKKEQAPLDIEAIDDEDFGSELTEIEEAFFEDRARLAHQAISERWEFLKNAIQGAEGAMKAMGMDTKEKFALAVLESVPFVSAGYAVTGHRIKAGEFGTLEFEKLSLKERGIYIGKELLPAPVTFVLGGIVRNERFQHGVREAAKLASDAYENYLKAPLLKYVHS